MTRLSVNINKVALIRNSRGEHLPDLIQVGLWASIITLCGFKSRCRIPWRWASATPRATPNKYVAAWQAMINELSGADLVVDGYYGKNTKTAVENLQRWYKVTVDGVLGPQTAGALLDRDPSR